MKKLFVSLALVVVASSSGCAALRAARARDMSLETSVTGHTYKKPCASVWAAARNILFSNNYTVQSTDAVGGLTLETEWRSDGSGTGSSSRYMIQGAAPTPDSCQISATRAYRSQNGGASMSRDWKMEWDILQQVDTAEASRIATEADAAAETARNQG